MDTNNLKAFIAVAQTGSFSLAALQLHLTQPAVSKRISVLESQFNSQLFDRIGRSVNLTEAGRTLLPRAKSILLEVEDTSRALSTLSEQVDGSLSLGTSHHIGLHRLPKVLRKFSQTYPLVHLDIHFTDSELAHQAVLQGEQELAVITLAPKPHPKIVSGVIWDDPLVFVAAADHPLANSPQLTLAELQHTRAILPGLNTYTGQIVQTLHQQQQLPLNTAMSTNYLETIKMMVSIGLGWSVLPLSMVDSQLSQLDVAGVALRRQLGIIYHRERALSNAASAFIAAITD